ncbi:MAG: DUF262 domain-containing protein [Elusimicrobiales bacterium]|nr:DUF262 domain-containing protein [Elusimicrobiales bacterium]
MKKDISKKPLNLANVDFLHRQHKLLINPEYQRGSVWSLSQRQWLIDSFFHKIDVPKVYFRSISKNNYDYEVVDGQQRIRAVIDFIGNGFKLAAESDPVDGNPIANRTYNELHSDLQMEFNNCNFDVVIMNEAYTDDDIEEMFLRLQNGTPLNAAEKRRAMHGQMRKVVETLGHHKIFSLCSFSDKRYAYEDAAAKVLHLTIKGGWADIRPETIKETYEANEYITETDPNVIKVAKAFNFISDAFKSHHSPKLKKYAIVTLTQLTINLLENYDLQQHKDKFAKAYLAFELKRRKNEELPEKKQNGELAAFTDAARSDSVPNMKYRHDLLIQEIIKDIPEMVLKDRQRGFSEEQRRAIYWQNAGKCQICKEPCTDSDFHADHIKPHSKGGETKISNGQVLCPGCNREKYNN